jgi:hypothetical protein
MTNLGVMTQTFDIDIKNHDLFVPLHQCMRAVNGDLVVHPAEWNWGVSSHA